jgi:GntR family transcriptional regulator, transcriptional repressor for pyruvate dehydrogenase complex
MRRPPSLPNAIMAEIQRLFIRRGLKAGDRLPPERELAKQLAVGRSSLREAMHGLQVMGFVWVRHGIGTFFASEPAKWLLPPAKFYDTPPHRLFSELIEARLLVEVRLAALAAERATKDDIARLREAADERACARRGEYVERGLHFHLAIAAAAHHSVLASMLQAVSHLYFDVLDSLDPADQGREAAFRARQQGGHDEVLRMIEARDPQGAADAMRAHLEDLQAEFPSIIEPPETAQSEKETV